MEFLKGTIEPNPITLGSDRFQFLGIPSKDDLKKLVNNSGIKILQTTENISDKIADRLNEYFFQFRPDVGLRLYGFIRDDRICDLRFCSRMNYVEHFYVDCMHNAEYVGDISKIENLKSLGLDIYNLDSFDVLKDINPNLENLSLGDTKSKKPKLEQLGRLRNLKSLLISGTRKDLSVISHCSELEVLRLRGVSTENVDFLRALKNLEDLSVYLGGIKDFSALKECKAVQKLDLFQIRGLSDLSFISEMTGLKTLFLESLKNVSTLPDMNKLTKLNRLVLQTMNGLKDVSALENIKNLTEFLHISSKNLQSSDYIPLFKNKTVEKIRVGFGSNRKNEDFRKLAKKYGKIPDEF